MFEKLKANPVFLVAVVVGIIGAIVGMYGKMKDKKYVMYAGFATAIGAFAVAIGSWAYTEYVTPPPEQPAARSVTGGMGSSQLSTSPF